MREELVCAESPFFKPRDSKAVGRVAQISLDKVERTRSWWEGFGSDGLMVIVCAQGGWAFSGSFLSVITLALRNMTSPRLAYPSKKGGQ